MDATWRHQIEAGEKPVIKGLRSVIGALTHISSHLPVKTRLLLANGLFMSKLLYLLPMWGGLPHRDVKTFQILMNKCARMVLGCSRKMRTRKLMESCNWLYFKEMVSYQSAVQLFKIINFNTPQNLRNKLTLLEDNKIQLAEARLKCVKKSFSWRTVCFWNDLPSEITKNEQNSPFLRKTSENT